MLVETLILGALGSVLGTFLFLFIDSYWRRLALPKLQDMVYRGVRVDGRWEFPMSWNDKEKQVYTLELVQHADKLTGSYVLSSDISEGMTVSSFIFSGYVSDGFVIGTARPSNRDSIYHTTFCLKIVEGLDALRLKGVLSGLTLRTNEISNWDVTFLRKST